jgi:hypothetical protein
VEVVRQPHKLDTTSEHIAAGLISASLCAAVPKRFLVHAAQLVGGKPISTRRVAMCAGHIINEIVRALLACISIASVFRDGNGVLARQHTTLESPRDRNTGRLRSGLFSSEPALKVISYELALAQQSSRRGTRSGCRRSRDATIRILRAVATAALVCATSRVSESLDAPRILHFASGGFVRCVPSKRIAVFLFVVLR